MKTFYLSGLVFAVLCFGKIHAQSVRLPVSSSYLSVGTYSTSHIDLLNTGTNQAALAQIKSISAAVFSERRFLLENMNLYRASISLPTSAGTFAVNTGYFGSTEYNESQVSLAYGRTLGDIIDIGVQFNYNNFRVTGYGNASAINFEAGAILHVSEKLHVGFHAANPVGGKIGKTGDEKLASVFKTGIGFEGSEKFVINAEIIKEENQPVNVVAGFQYKFIRQIMLRAGISSTSSAGFVGVGLTLNSFRLDLTSSFHQQLGFTPGLLILFNFNNQKN